MDLIPIFNTIIIMDMYLTKHFIHIPIGDNFTMRITADVYTSLVFKSFIYINVHKYNN